MTSYQVTGTATNNTFTGGMIKVYVLDNASVGTPATGSSTTAFDCSVTTTVTGSYVFGGANNQTAGTAFSAAAGTTNSLGEHDWLLVLQGPGVTPVPLPASPANRPVTVPFFAGRGR